MTLLELSAVYRESARMLRQRMRELDRKKKLCGEDREAIRRLDRRIADLDPLLREARELAILTASYYDKGYHKNEKYTL